MPQQLLALFPLLLLLGFGVGRPIVSGGDSTIMVAAAAVEVASWLR